MAARREARLRDDTSGPTRPPGLGRLLREADLAFHQVMGARLARHGVSVAQYQHLRRLWDGDGISQNQLSRSLGVREASSTPVLAALEEKGLLTRRRSPGDRRKLLLFLTPAGAALEAELVALSKACSAEALAGFTAAEAQAFRDMLRRVSAAMRAPVDQG